MYIVEHRAWPVDDQARPFEHQGAGELGDEPFRRTHVGFALGRQFGITELAQQGDSLLRRPASAQILLIERDQRNVVLRGQVDPQRKFRRDKGHLTFNQLLACAFQGVAVGEGDQMYLSANEITSMSTRTKKTRIMPFRTDTGTMNIFFGVSSPALIGTEVTTSPNSAHFATRPNMIA